MGVNKAQRKISPGSGVMYHPGPGIPPGPVPGHMPMPIMEKPHTLRNYAADHFRSPLPSPKSSIAGGTMMRPLPPHMMRDMMWRHSRVPITDPLLRRLLNKEELAHQACVTFHTILMYMGDIPGRQSRVGLELTDLIFTGPLKQASLILTLWCN